MRLPPSALGLVRSGLAAGPGLAVPGLAVPLPLAPLPPPPPAAAVALASEESARLRLAVDSPTGASEPRPGLRAGVAAAAPLADGMLRMMLAAGSYRKRLKQSAVRLLPRSTAVLTAQPPYSLPGVTVSVSMK